MKEHEFYMAEAIKQAKKGWGATNPNPLVGSVIEKDRKILARGYHEKIGGAHAEINVLKNLVDLRQAKGATLYVNLEPCAHYGKTPPCANRLTELGLKRVVIGMKDPNPKVSGKGIEILKNAGIDVVSGVLEDECTKLNEIFIKYITKKKPFVILKSAMTMDGKISTRIGDTKWITSDKARRYVHKLRDRVASVMIGINTAISDNPALNVRLVDQKGMEPYKIVVDSQGRLPIDCKLIKNMKKEHEVILATTSKVKEKEYVKRGVLVLKLDGPDGKVDLNLLMDKLYELGIDSVLLEGGSTLNASALGSGIVDKVVTIVAPKIVGGECAKTPVGGQGVDFLIDAIRMKDISTRKLGNDIMIEGLILRDGEV
ncbi:MAG: bifunctional diaminohydroxyphosphoribosylaminopyrimidine deaminase/5-amino-6-(5-phosphoribosylamino)uracil reductase RibD [Clostridiales bacterium]|nr:bifunctional diaminohydroxyphosphoribosylaminopyrimidine deaminase/5-amino-6-(5-phosphoribosylamino)uracil reductase RibD [Clostridiales bacterium]